MKLFFVNNEGGGYADHIDVEPGTTVRQLFSQRMKNAQPVDFLIRVNRQPVPADQVLQDLDRVSFTPTKVHGAA